MTDEAGIVTPRRGMTIHRACSTRDPVGEQIMYLYPLSFRHRPIRPSEPRCRWQLIRGRRGGVFDGPFFLGRIVLQPAESAHSWVARMRTSGLVLLTLGPLGRMGRFIGEECLMLRVVHRRPE
jgi:hypothetical protein